jgi:phenylpyruvate tautomerase PptA (4-oxalocrotonate tautomerase family)
MSFYEIQHHCPIGPSQRKELAQKLTQLHANAFDTPLMFVNVRFHIMDFSEENFFVGGESQFRTNQIFVYIHGGPERTSAVLNKLAADIEKVWDEVVGGGYRKTYRLPTKEEETKLPADWRKIRLREEGPKLLQGVFVVPELAVREEGFEIPLVSFYISLSGSGGYALMAVRLVGRKTG